MARFLAMIATFNPFFKVGTKDVSPHARSYVSGLMQGPRGRKNVERMEEVVEGLDGEGVQHMLADSGWKHEPLIEEIGRQADGLLGGGPRARLILDESAFAKRGDKSVAVARQYNGNLGKIDNCQVAVFGVLSNGAGMGLPVDVRLYVPRAWSQSAVRCERAGIPEAAREDRSKAQLALEIVRAARERGLRYARVLGDAGYGSQPGFLRALEEAGESFVMETHRDQRIWLEHPWPQSGAEKEKPRAQSEAVKVEDWAQAPGRETDWEILRVRESAKGWVEVQTLSQRVWVWDRQEDQPRLWWLLVWENLNEGPGPRRHYALSNAPAESDVRRLIGDGVSRYWIEHSFREGKQEAGMGDYQVRGWMAWHHHMALVMLAMLFITREKLHYAALAPGDELPMSAGDVVFLLEHFLPRRLATEADIHEALEIRRHKRREDQRRARQRAAQKRPPFLALDDLPK